MSTKKIFPSRVDILKEMKIEVYGTLTEKFGCGVNMDSPRGIKENNSAFQLDRLFTILHNN
jgi:hypothetical protein